jgi:hypothetical protein
MWTDVAGVVILAIQLVLLIVAAIYARGQLRSAREQLKAAEELREDQTPPFVVIDLESEEPPFVDLVIKNIGPTMARDVTFEFDGTPLSTIEDIDLSRIKMFSEGISFLPPGKEIRTLFDRSDERQKIDMGGYTVTVRYNGPSGRAYSEEMELDFELYWHRWTLVRHSIHHVHAELKKIREEIGRWKSPVGRGLQVVTPADIEERNAEYRTRLEAIKEQQGPHVPPAPKGDEERGDPDSEPS